MLSRFWRLERFWLVSAYRHKGNEGFDNEGVGKAFSGVRVAGSDGESHADESISLLVLEVVLEPSPHTDSVLSIPSESFVGEYIPKGGRGGRSEESVSQDSEASLELDSVPMEGEAAVLTQLGLRIGVGRGGGATKSGLLGGWTLTFLEGATSSRSPCFRFPWTGLRLSRQYMMEMWEYVCWCREDGVKNNWVRMSINGKC